MIWSDETEISIFGSDGQKYVKLFIGEEVHPDCIQATTNNLRSVIIWTCMSANVVGRFHVRDETLENRNYIDTILQQKLLYSFRDLIVDNVFYTSRIQLLATPQGYANSGSRKMTFR